MAKKVVLAYSGGLDTSVIMKWLQDVYGYEVIAMIADVGQDEDLKKIEEKAYKTGATKVYVEDLREEFVNSYIIPALKIGAIYEDKYLLGTSLARPLIAKRQIEIAKKEGAEAVAHGATGKGNDQVRFELTYMAIEPSIKVIAPWKDEKWDLTSREKMIDYALKNGIEVPVTKEKIYSEDANLLHISHEGGELEDPKNEPMDRVFTYSLPLEKASDTPEYVKIDFKEGIPIKLNDKTLSPLEILMELNKIGAKHGIGQVDMVENRLVGMKSRGVYETPGGTILYKAYREIEELVFDRETSHFKRILSDKYAELVYYGLWFTPLRKAIEEFFDYLHKRTSGWVKLKLYKGNIISAGKDSKNSLYIEDLASFGETDLYDHKDAKGFIKLFGLPLKVRALKGIDYDE